MEFTEEYVKQLREENAKWRTKLRELEVEQQKTQVETELAKRGIQADPSWVTLEEGKTIGESVDALVTRFPNLGKQQAAATDTDDLDLFVAPEPKKVTPKPIAPSTPASTTPKPARVNRISSRNIAEIRKDPQARAKVRDLYRSVLQQGSNQGE